MIEEDRSLKTLNEEPGDKYLASVANTQAEIGIDSYSNYGVGVSLLVKVDFDEATGGDKPEVEYKVYGGSNINLSGTEIKMHAEQLALYQAIMDIEYYDMRKYSYLEKIIVVTTEHDMALRCGHCFQVLQAGCQYLRSHPDKLDYIAARKEDNVWMMEKFTLGDLFPGSYTMKRDAND